MVSKEQYYDVIIVGAGPAGCSTAYELGKEFKVLLLDKGELPQEKVCGGLLCEESVKILKEWGMPRDVLLPPSKLKLRIIDWDHGLNIDTNKEFWNADRKKLNRWLLKRLPSSVSIVPKAKVTDVRVGQSCLKVAVGNFAKSIKCRYLVGADGVLSVVRREKTTHKTNKTRLIQSVVESENNLGKHSFFIFDSKISPTFYSWAFPKDGCTIIGTKIEGNRNNLNILTGKLKELGISGEKIRTEGHLITLIDDVKRDIILGNGNVLLTGEAAGLVSPSSGEGISYALQSGVSAAKAIKNGNDPVESYRESCKPIIDRLSSQLEKARLIFDKESRVDYLRGL